MYGNYYSPQASIDRINNQIAELERIKAQIPNLQQPTNLTQNFQLAPNGNSGIRYANSLEDVKKEYVLGDTPFFSKDYSVLWLKNGSNQVKTYELREIVNQDEKDVKIAFLTAQIDELRREIRNNGPINDDVDEPVKDEKSVSVPTISKSSKKSK